MPSTVTVTIGAGGAAGAAQTSGSGSAGSAGGNTTFGSLLSAIGGSGGSIATYNPGGAGGGNGLGGTGYGTNGGALADYYSTGFAAEFGGGSGGAGKPNNQNFGAGGGLSVFGGSGGAGGVPIGSSSSGYSLFGGISTDNLTTTNTTGAAPGTPTSPNGNAGAAQRAILPIGGGGGAGAAGVPIYPTVTKDFVANGRVFQQLSTGLIYSADNGATWTYINFLPYSCVGIGYINSTYYAGMSNGLIFSSTNLSTWTQVSAVTTTGNLTGFASNATTLVACGQISGSNYGQMYYSTNGTTWTQGFAGNGGGAYNTTVMRYSNGYFWGYIPGNLRFGASQFYQYSSDGINWNNINTGQYWVGDVSFGATNAVAINVRSSGVIYGLAYGTPGAIGTQVLAGTYFNDIAYGGGIFVAVGAAGSIYTSSDDGVNWTAQTSGTSDDLINVVWSGTRFIAFTSNNGFKTITSTNGVTWSTGVTIAATAFNGGTGGAGGIASGGGGGGAALATYSSGAGGAGGNGYARILSW